MKQVFKPKFRYTFDGAVKTSRTQALLWRNIGPLPRKCAVSLSSLRIVKKCGVFFQRSRVLAGSQGLKRTKWKINTPNVDACAVINSTSKSEVFPTWAPLPNHKEMKASLSKSTSFQIHSSKCSFKTAFFQTSIFKFYLPISALLLPNCSTSSFQKLVEKVQNYVKEVWLIFKKWVWRVDFERFFWQKKVFCLVKWAKTNAFLFNR